MTKKRSTLIFVVFLTLFFILFLSSSFFKLSEIEIKFFNSNNQNIDIKENVFFKNSTQLEKLKSLGKQDIGKSLFLINTEKYFYKFESENPYAKLLDIKSKYPNKLVFCVSERKPFYYIKSQNTFFILDQEFKILQICEKLNNKDLIEIKILSYNSKNIDFFTFFNVSVSAFVEGQFLSENNLLLQSIKNFNNIFLKSIIKIDNLSSITFEEQIESINLIISTSGEYGASFKIDNILKNFDKKLSALLKEFESSLIQNDKLKICFGMYQVNENLKVSWNNL